MLPGETQRLSAAEHAAVGCQRYACQLTLGGALINRDGLLEHVLKLAETRKRVILGLAGPPAAGKSTLAQWVVESLSSAEVRSAYVPLDGYHLSNSQLQRLGLTARKGSPESFDAAGFSSLLRRLRAHDSQATIYAPSYSRELHEPIAGDINVDADVRIVLVEGNYLLLDRAEWRRGRGYLDASWWIDERWRTCRRRLVERQLNGGRDQRQAEAWVDGNDRANYEYVIKHSSRGDGVIEALEAE